MSFNEPEIEITNLKFNINSFGITARSLKELRDVLSRKIDEPLAVVQIPTSELTCAFLVLDPFGNAFLTGDGFRTDSGGEGGAGYRAAVHLVEKIYRIPIVHATKPVLLTQTALAFTSRTLKVNTELLRKALTKQLNTIVKELFLKKEDFTVPARKLPAY